MTVEKKIKELSNLYLADIRAPDIVRFVDQLFHVAAETGNLAGVFDGDKKLRFFVRPPRTRGQGSAPTAAQLPAAACIVEHETARIVLRMICARLGVICKERTATDLSPYSNEAEIGYAIQAQERWKVSVTNTPERQEFCIEAL
jgi:hypothetical protein